MARRKRFWSMRWLWRWIIPLPLQIRWFKRISGDRWILYQDPEIAIVLRRKKPLPDFTAERWRN